MNWWPCFVCESEHQCSHREPEIVIWMRDATPAQVLASLPPRKPAAREMAAAAGGSGEQFELFGLWERGAA